jgi:predicted CoA-binding protein
MQNIQEAAAAFLPCKRVAVTGVSRTPKTHGSNDVYRRLPERGYEVFAVNPSTGQVEGGLTSTGMSAGPAVSAVLVYRPAIHWLPVAPGRLSWQALQQREYV